MFHIMSLAAKPNNGIKGYERDQNDLKMQAVWAKTCRGAMARFIIENRITIPKHLNTFCYEGFTYNPALG